MKLSNLEILENAIEGSTHVSECGGNYYKEVPSNKDHTLHELFVWCRLDNEWLKPKTIRSIRSIKDIKQIIKFESYNMNELRGLPKDIDLLITASNSLVTKVKDGGLISDRVVHLEKVTTKVNEQYQALFK